MKYNISIQVTSETPNQEPSTMNWVIVPAEMSIITYTKSLEDVKETEFKTVTDAIITMAPILVKRALNRDRDA